MADDQLYVNFIKYTNIDTEGKEIEKETFAVHVFNDFREIMTEHTSSLDDLNLNIGYFMLLDYIENLEEESFYLQLVNNGGLFFNNDWVSFEELKRVKLIKECSLYYQPGDEPDFDYMTTTQIEKHITYLKSLNRKPISVEEINDQRGII